MHLIGLIRDCGAHGLSLKTVQPSRRCGLRCLRLILSRHSEALRIRSRLLLVHRYLGDVHVVIVYDWTVHIQIDILEIVDNNLLLFLVLALLVLCWIKAGRRSCIWLSLMCVLGIVHIVGLIRLPFYLALLIEIRVDINSLLSPVQCAPSILILPACFM